MAGCSAVAAGAAIVALVVGPANVVPGLLLAFPLALAGLLVAGRRTLRTSAAQIAAGVSVLFVLAVLATQYAKGGGGEWGGRYFALAIPLYVPVLLLALRHRRTAWTPGSPESPSWAWPSVPSALSAMAVGAVAIAPEHARLVAAVDRAGQTVSADDPVMVTTEGAMPRFAWPTFDRQRWLLTAPDGLDDLLGRLRAPASTGSGS